MRQSRTLAIAGLFLLLAACGSTGGGILNPSSSPSTYNIQGTVDSVDLNTNSIYLVGVSGMSGTMLSSSGGNAVRVYFDNNTPVSWNGQNYRATDLERGDQVSVRVDDNGSRLNAESMNVLVNARNNTNNNGTYGNYPANGSMLHGTVTSVDTRNRTIMVDTGYGSRTVTYDSNTPVYFNGQNYRPTDLERGDQIDIQTSTLGSGQLLAQTITVTRSISSNNTNGTSNPSSTYATVRGTVSYVDTANHTIQLSSSSWISGFNRNAGSSASTMTVQYDPATQISVGGQLYAVSGLERGDVIDVQVSNAGASVPFATGITLVRDVNGRN